MVLDSVSEEVESVFVGAAVSMVDVAPPSVEMVVVRNETIKRKQ